MVVFMGGVAAVHEDAESKKLGRGHAGHSSLPCSICKDGTIHYFVAGVNGHIHAVCSTEGCLRFME